MAAAAARQEKLNVLIVKEEVLKVIKDAWKGK